MAFADVGAVRLFYTDEGTGDPPVLFIHGYTCDSHDWQWQLPSFGALHRVIAADLRGHGRSSAPEEGYDARTLADDLARLLEQLDCGPVVAIGHSLGGVVATMLAVDHPALVRALVCVDPTYLLPETARAGTDDELQRLDADAVTTVQGLLGAIAYTPASPPHLKAWHMRRIAGTPAHVLQGTGHALLSGPGALAYTTASEQFVRQRTLPVLSIHAAQGRAAVEAPLLTHPRSTTIAWDGSGHWLHQERPHEFNSVVASWITELGD